jgi:hypothetical protein
MILDEQLRISSAQVATTNTTTVTTNAYDTGLVGRRVGTGEPLVVVFFVEAITAAADTFSFEAISATDAALTGTVTRLALRGPFAAATIPIGTAVVIDIPPGMATQRYIGGRYTLGAADALTASAFVMPRSFLTNLAYFASGFTIV